MYDNINSSEMTEKNGSLLWVIIRSNNSLFGFDAGKVGNMIAIPTITHVPGSIDYMPGTITIRDKIHPLIDLRIYTGQPSAEQEIQEFCDLMDQRLCDHQNWIKELKASVEEEREFKLATDPHKCAFGKWYDTFSSDNRIVNGILPKFDAPHRTIHGIADKVTKLVSEKKIDEAHDLINKTSNAELTQMVRLFSEIKNAVRDARQRRIAMVLEKEDGNIALDIDEVVAVEVIEKVEPNRHENLKSLGVSRIGRRNKTEELVFLVESLDL